MRPVTAAVGVTFVTVVFFALPRAFMALSSALDWPRLEGAATRGIGWCLIAAGIGVALWASAVFRRAGEGTPVPIEPPRRLVDTGLYRHSRNPIYVADLVILFGIFLVEGHLGLLLYVVVFGALIQAWLVLHEEPELLRRHGVEWERYAEHVPRWLRARAEG